MKFLIQYIRANGSDQVCGNVNMPRRPTFAEAETAMQEAHERGCDFVRWWVSDGLSPQDRSPQDLRRCSCGNVAVNDEACKLCRALAPLVTSQDYSSREDLQARYEAADRYLDRIAKVVADLKTQIDTFPPENR